MSNYNKVSTNGLINDYLKKNKHIYPLEIERILGIEYRQALRLYLDYRKDTKDKQNNYVDAQKFFEYYNKRKHRWR